MSESCKYCWIISRNACSEYSGQALVEELANCGNLDRESQLRNAASAEGYSGPYSILYAAYENNQEEKSLIDRMYAMLLNVQSGKPVDVSELEDVISDAKKWISDAYLR